MDGPTKKAAIDSILAYINRLPRAAAIKCWGLPQAIAGDPDICALLRARPLALFVQSPSDRVSPRQKERCERWKEAGALVATVSSVADVRRLLQDAYV